MLLESLPITLGQKMPDFNLLTPTGESHSLNNTIGPKGLLIIFTCNHCPYAIAIWPRIVQLAKEAQTLGIKTVGINPNIHPSYPEDRPEKMIEKIAEWGIPFPYLVDEDQTVAKAYQAQCTPDLYLVNQNKELVYHGRLDDNWKDPKAVKQQELRTAILNLSQELPISTIQHPSMGCSIKWL